MNNMASEDGEDEKVRAARDAFTNDSAFMVAYERALETEKGEQALISDPFAAKLIGDRGKELSDSFGVSAAAAFGLWPDFHKQWTVVRTKFIDDTLARVVASDGGVKRQFVNLGAGLDTRVFRLVCASSFAGAYEVDMEAINAPKRALLDALALKPLCSEHALVSTDLTQKGQLQQDLSAAGFDAGRPSVIVAEGLIMYLGEAQRSFLEEVSALAAAGSVLVLNFMDVPKEHGIPMSELTSILQSLGWHQLTYNHFGDHLLDYGRFQREFTPSKCFSFVVCSKPK